MGRNMNQDEKRVVSQIVAARSLGRLHGGFTSTFLSFSGFNFLLDMTCMIGTGPLIEANSNHHP